jgi:hypothetical protein
MEDSRTQAGIEVQIMLSGIHQREKAASNLLDLNISNVLDYIY